MAGSSLSAIHPMLVPGVRDERIANCTGKTNSGITAKERGHTGAACRKGQFVAQAPRGNGTWARKSDPVQPGESCGGTRPLAHGPFRFRAPKTLARTGQNRAGYLAPGHHRRTADHVLPDREGAASIDTTGLGWDLWYTERWVNAVFRVEATALITGSDGGAQFAWRASVLREQIRKRGKAAGHSGASRDLPGHGHFSGGFRSPVGDGIILVGSGGSSPAFRVICPRLCETLCETFAPKCAKTRKI